MPSLADQALGRILDTMIAAVRRAEAKTRERKGKEKVERKDGGPHGISVFNFLKQGGVQHNNASGRGGSKGLSLL
jgi:hypothetical protein